MLDHRLSQQALNIGHNVQKRRILSYGWVFDIMKWFNRCGVKGLVELSFDVMKL